MGEARRRSEVTEAINAGLERAAREAGMSKGDVIRKALSLFDDDGKRKEEADNAL